METKKSAIYFSLVLTMLFWGVTFVFYKFAFESFRPVTVIFLRLIVSVPFIFIAAGILKKLQRPDKEDFGFLALLALLEPFFYFMGESYGLTYVSSTLAAVIVSTIPLVVPIAAFFAYREKLNVMNIIGLFISFGGVLMVVLANDVDWGATMKGVLLMFMAVFSAVGYAVLVKKLTHKYNGFTITVYQNLFGIFFFMPFFFWWDFDTFINTIPSWKSISALLYLAIFGSSITFILFTAGVRELGASKANVFANLIPVFAAFFSFLLLDEPMPSLKILGIVFVLTGLILTQIRRVKFRKVKTPPTIQFPG